MKINTEQTHVLHETTVQNGVVEDRFCILYNNMTELEVGDYNQTLSLYNDLGKALKIAKKNKKNKKKTYG